MLRLQPTRVRLSPDENGFLIYVDDALIAVLVQLSALHGEEAGCWSVEAVFGARLNPSGMPPCLQRPGRRRSGWPSCPQ